MGVFRAIKNVYDGVLKTINAILSWLIIAMMVILTIQAITRYFSNVPASWPTDISTYIMVAMSFMGMGWILRIEKHVAVDLVVNFFGKKVQTVIAIITSLVGLITCVVIAYATIMATISQYTRNVLITGSFFYFPKWILIAIISIGLVITTIEFIARVVKYILLLVKDDKEPEDVKP